MANQNTYGLTYPIRKGQIEDWDLMERFWEQCIFKYLRCEPEDHYFVLVRCPFPAGAFLFTFFFSRLSLRSTLPRTASTRQRSCLSLSMFLVFTSRCRLCWRLLPRGRQRTRSARSRVPSSMPEMVSPTSSPSYVSLFVAFFRMFPKRRPCALIG